MQQGILGVSNPIEFSLIVGVTGIGGQTVTLNIRRDSDTAPKKWWDGSAWETTKTALAMSEFDSVNCVGLYSYAWTPDGIGLYTLSYIVAGTYEQVVNEKILVVDMALNSTVAKEETLNTKIPTALSFDGANVNAAVAALGTDTISADAVSAGAVTKITTDLATGTEVSAVNDNVLDTYARVETAETAIIAAPIVIGSEGETPVKLLSDLKKIMDGIDDQLTADIQ